ncbi:MAG: DUF3592 domain-containing protein [Clostridia bacterium]|nr:DUF3592 domain-containing protein [Clostridia bacterium]
MKPETKIKIRNAFIVILVASLVSVALYFIKTEQYKDWQSTDGVLIDTQQFYGRKSKVGGGRSYRLYYQYTVDGVTYEGNELFSGNVPDSHYIGEPVTVWYNPENHSSSCYAKPGPGLWPYAPFFLGFPILLSALGVRKIKVRAGT